MFTADNDRRPVAVALTPPGRGAVASVLVSGSGAAASVAKFFAPASGEELAATPIGQVVFGRGGEAGEELVVCRRGDDEIEIHCHGGEAAIAAVLASLGQLGCREISWQAWNRRHTADFIAAEAAEALSRAATLRAAAILLDQYQGALRRELDRCAELLEAPDAASWRAAHERLESLRGRWRLGRHLTEPFRIVLAGPPNVGKSSLINAIVGYPRSIVYDQPGTTRDVVSAPTAVAGWPVEISDTAGLRPCGDPLEAAGARLARQRLVSADLQILVFDASRRWSEDDAALYAEWPEAVVVYNKSDLPAYAADRPTGMHISALTGAGIDELLRLASHRLAPEPPPPGSAVPFTAIQERLIAAVIPLVAAGERAEAARRMREFHRAERVAP